MKRKSNFLGVLGVSNGAFEISVAITFRKLRFKIGDIFLIRNFTLKHEYLILSIN